jgi:hypothetical protein
VNVAKILLPERKSWFQSERERLKFQQETGGVIPAPEVAREYSSIAKAPVQVLEALPDILERDCAIVPAAVVRGQKVIDDQSDQIASKVDMADTLQYQENLPEKE